MFKLSHHCIGPWLFKTTPKGFCQI